MTDSYEERQQAKKERLLEGAEKARGESQSHWTAARRAVADIPFGQPILVGHHSEGRHRAAIGKYDSGMRKSIAADDKAKELSRRASAVGRGGISSDDPAALEKLRAEVKTLSDSHAVMKSVNAVIRAKNKTPAQKTAAIVALGLSVEQAESVQRPDPMGRIGFAPYVFANGKSNIRRIEKRIVELEAIHARADVEIVGPGYTYREDTTENRVMFLFDDKPDEETRKRLRLEGFVWSPKREGKPHVRKLTGNGIYAGQAMCAWLNKKSENKPIDNF